MPVGNVFLGVYPIFAPMAHHAGFPIPHRISDVPITLFLFRPRNLVPKNKFTLRCFFNTSTGFSY